MIERIVPYYMVIPAPRNFSLFLTYYNFISIDVLFKYCGIDVTIILKTTIFNTMS